MVQLRIVSRERDHHVQSPQVTRLCLPSTRVVPGSGDTVVNQAD